MKVSLHHNMNNSDWSKVLLHSKYRANVLISRMHAARSNSNSNSTFIHQLSIVSGNSDGTCYIVNVGFGTPPKQNIKMKFDTAATFLGCSAITTLVRLLTSAWIANHAIVRWMA